MECLVNKILELRNLSIGYQKDILSKNINAIIEKGQIIALVGRNGVGKSCLLKTIAGLLISKSGSVIVNEKEISKFSPKELSQVISVLLTEKIEVDFLTVHELIKLGRSPYSDIYGKYTEEDNEIIKKTISLLGLEKLLDLYFSSLSDGQKQKVLIARALVQKPSLLILDEPNIYLDSSYRKELMSNLKKSCEENNLSIIFSTHDSELASEYSNIIWHLDNEGVLHEREPVSIRGLNLN